MAGIMDMGIATIISAGMASTAAGMAGGGAEIACQNAGSADSKRSATTMIS